MKKERRSWEKVLRVLKLKVGVVVGKESGTGIEDWIEHVLVADFQSYFVAYS